MRAVPTGSFGAPPPRTDPRSEFAVIRILALVLFLLLARPSGAEPWQGGGPEIAWVTSLLQPLGADGPLWAGTYGGGVWRYDAGAGIWREYQTNIRDAVVRDLVRGHDVDQSLYAGTEDRGVLRSEGFSSLWIEANTGLSDPLDRAVFALDTYPLDPNRIVAGTGSGARASSSRGNVWGDSLRVSPVQPVRAVRVLSERPRTVHYLGAGELGRQRGFDAVVEVFDDGVRDGAFFFDFAPWPNDPDRFLVADFDGAVWDFSVPTFTFLDASTGLNPPPRFYTVDVTAAAGVPVIRIGADRGLFTSTDAGQSWTRTTPGRSPVNAEVWEVLVEDADDGTLMLGTFGDGVLRLENGVGRPMNAGLRAAWVRAVDARDGVVLAGTAHGRLYRSDDGALSWTEVTGSLDDLQLTTVWLGDGSPWMVTAAGGVFLTEDEGTTWTPASLPAGASRLNVIVAAESGRLLAASDDGLLESKDEGRSWNHVEGLDERRTSFAVTWSAGRTAVAFAPSGTLPGTIHLARQGAEFEQIDVGSSVRTRGLVFADDETGPVLLAAVLPTFEGNLLRVRGVGVGERIEVETDDSGPAGAFVEPRQLVGVNGTSRIVLATAAHGIRVSDDAGRTWSARNDGLASLRTEEVAVDVIGGDVRLALGTFARGAWTTILDDVVKVDDEPRDDSPAPSVTRLLAPAPNPFNPRTTIRWEQAVSGPVEIDLYDLRGRLVRALVRTRVDPGRHGVEWDGTDDAGRPVASGTYLARLRAEGRVHGSRLTLIR